MKEGWGGQAGTEPQQITDRIATRERVSSLHIARNHLKLPEVVSRAKWRMFKECSHKIPLAERPEARLPCPTQTGGHQVCITRKGDPALQFVMNYGRETHLLCPSASPRGKPQTAVGQITWKYRAWQALGILSQFRGSPPSLLYPILSSATISSTWTTTNVSKTVIYLMNLLSTPALTPKETLYLPART